jgi:hypothetical protein
MKTLLAAALLCVAVMPAHAELQCSGFTQAIGQAGRNPPVSAAIGYTADGEWYVHYMLANGMTVDRSQQYDMRRMSDSTRIGWDGYSRHNPNLWMSGELIVRPDDQHRIYVERLYNRSNTLLSRNEIDCGVLLLSKQRLRQPSHITRPPSLATLCRS